MNEDCRDSSPTEVTTNSAINKAAEKKVRNRPLTKIVIRRLPPTMTEEAFLEQVSPVPDYDYFYFTQPDMTLGPCAYSRAYMNLVNIEDIYLFKDKFDGYVFLDEKGVEYVGVVEYAPFQRIPKKRRKKDPKSGTIESDPVYQEFLESLNEPEMESREPKLEYSYPVNDGNDKRVISTPLLDFLASRKNEKKTRDERRRRETERRKPRLDRRNKEGTIKIMCFPEACPLPTSFTNKDLNLKMEHKSTTLVLENHEECLGNKYVTYPHDKFISSSTQPKKIVRGHENYRTLNSVMECHFPALPMRSLNTFTLPNQCDDLSELTKSHLYSSIIMSQSCGDNNIIEEEEIEETDVKKIKTRDWEKQSGKKNDDEESNSPKKVNVESKDGKNTTLKGKSYKDQWKTDDSKKKYSEKTDFGKSKDWNHDGDKLSRREKREKLREPSKDQKTKEVKRYSDTRKERTKLRHDDETAEKKPKSNTDIKPFTQLPDVKTEDLSKVIEAMERNVTKLSISEKVQDEPEADRKSEPDESSKGENINSNNAKTSNSEIEAGDDRSSDKECVQRCSSLEADNPAKEDNKLRRHKSLEDNAKDEDTLRRHKSLEDNDKEDDLDKNEEDCQDSRKERRIRNKDRPSLAIYQPGMGRFSKQRISKDTDKPDKLDKTDKLDTAKAPKDT